MGHSTADEIIEVAWQKFLLSKMILATCFNIGEEAWSLEGAVPGLELLMVVYLLSRIFSFRREGGLRFWGGFSFCFLVYCPCQFVRQCSSCRAGKEPCEPYRANCVLPNFCCACRRRYDFHDCCASLKHTTFISRLDVRHSEQQCHCHDAVSLRECTGLPRWKCLLSRNTCGQGQRLFLLLYFWLRRGFQRRIQTHLQQEELRCASCC